MTSECKTICNIEVVNEVRNHEIELMMLERTYQFFKAIADPTRLRILYSLRQAPICVGDLAIALGMTKSAISHQLRYLRDCQLVTRTKKGKMSYYHLSDQHVADILQTTLEHLEEKSDEEKI